MFKGKNMCKKIEVRVTNAELNLIKSLSNGKSMSSYLRELVILDSKKATDDAGQLVKMIRSIDAGEMAQKVNDLHDKFSLIEVSWFIKTLQEISLKVQNGAVQPDEKPDDQASKIDDSMLKDIFTFLRAELGPIARNASVLGSTLGEIQGDGIMIARNLRAPEDVKPATRYPEENSDQSIGEDPLKKIIRSELSGISSSISNTLMSAFNAWARTSNTKMHLIENEVTVKAATPKKGGK